MSGARDAATRAQIRAADPGASTWVSANAGSGKTSVLTQRVARLLLAGAPPQRILCITYTRAAAAEMQNRLFAMLGDWAMAEDAALSAALDRLEETPPAARSAEDLAAARRLFAKALETPGGLKIQTIHSFCDGLLRRFPLEAGVAPGFRMLEDREAAALAEDARRAMAERALVGADDAFALVAHETGEASVADLCTAILGARAAFADPEVEARSVAALGGETWADARDGALAALDPAPLRAIAAGLAKGSPTDVKLAQVLHDGLAARGPALLDAIFSTLFTQKGAPRARKSWPSKAARAAAPDLDALLDTAIAAAEAARERLRAAKAADRTRALHRFARGFIGEYEAAKARIGALDHDDLITRSRDLLTRSDMGPWALYKLDGGIDHILVDEAQDTSPIQWEVIRAIADEFVAGEAARGSLRRTIFAVGDEKQSIYSFQGAEPRAFRRMRDHFAARLEAAGAPLADGALETSFRSAPAILNAVDAAFAREGAAAGLSADGAPPAHLAHHADRPGRVDIWPLIEPVKAPDDGTWDEPMDLPNKDNPKARLAAAAGDEIARILREETLPGTDRRVAPGDILVLMSARGGLALQVIRRLKQKGVAVAGADRLAVGEELAVRDLLALARVALTPGDDLSLAALLRSPLGGLSEDALFDLAHGRGPASLLSRLEAAEAAHPAAVALLRAARDAADFLRPFEFFDLALTGHKGRLRLLARLGVEAEDAIDEFLSLTLAYETAETPSLEGFLAWMERDASDLKRLQDGEASEVRVMTVHGAKGLEAPVVMVLDAVSDRGRPPGPVAVERDPVHVFWRSLKEEEPARLAAIRETEDRRDAEEDRRLLYVAATRAERWLIAAPAGETKAYDNSWSALLAAGARDLGAVEAPAPAGLDGPMLRLESGMSRAAAPAPPLAAAPTPPPAAAPVPAPAWVTTPAPPLVRRETVSASALGGGHGAAAPGLGLRAPDGLSPLERGDAIHALLEAPIPPDAAEAEVIFNRVAPGAKAAARAALLAEAAAARAVPDAARFFAPGARAEVAISHLLPDGRRLRGRLDRLDLSGGRADILDMKTDAAPPASADAVPEAYLRQLAAYRAALAALFPEAAPRAYLLWTAAPALMEIPSAALDGAFARLLADPGSDGA